MKLFSFVIVLIIECRVAFCFFFTLILIEKCCDTMKATDSGHNMGDVKKINRGLILYLIYKNKGLSRKTLSAKTGLTPAAITLIIGDMIREGLLVETDAVHNGNTLGRKEVILNINLRAYVALGIHLEPHRAKVRCCDLSDREIFQAEILNREREKSFSCFLEAVAAEISGLLEEHRIKAKYCLIGAGVALPVNEYEKGRGEKDPEYGKKKFLVQEILSQRLGIDVWPDSLACTMVSADIFLSQDPIGQNILFVKYGPEVDASYLSLAHYPQQYRSVPISLNHTLVDPQGKECGCGGKGCLHTVAGFQELAEEIRGIYSEEKTPKLFKLTRGDKNQVVGSRVAEFYQCADPAVRAVIEKGAFYLAMVLKNCLNMLHLSSVVVYGELFFDSQYWNYFCGLLDTLHCRGQVRLSHFRRDIETEGPAFSMVGRFFANGGLLDGKRK